MSIDIQCDHCEVKIVPIDYGVLDEAPQYDRVVWCPECVEVDYTGELAKTFYNAQSRIQAILSSKAKGYLCYFQYPENVVKMRAVPKRIKGLTAPKEIKEIVVVVKAEAIPTLCKKIYYGISCLCDKCGSSGQVLPFRDVFGYGKEKTNEQNV